MDVVIWSLLTYVGNYADGFIVLL